jgi:hypothetical protein
MSRSAQRWPPDVGLLVRLFILCTYHQRPFVFNALWWELSKQNVWNLSVLGDPTRARKCSFNRKREKERLNMGVRKQHQLRSNIGRIAMDKR